MDIIFDATISKISRLIDRFEFKLGIKLCP